MAGLIVGGFELSRPDHKPTGELCTRCGQPSSAHRGRRADYRKVYRVENPEPRVKDLIIGIDGEGQGRRCAECRSFGAKMDGCTCGHIYNYVAAADEGGRIWELGADRRKAVSTEDFLEFVLDLPAKSLVFGFALLYDLTKALTDLPDSLLYLLFHEERRALIKQGDKGPEVRYRPIRWRGFHLNYMHRKFTVRRGKQSKCVWDVFAFFQSKFTKACIDWQIGDKDTVSAMETMKERRSSFDAQSWTEIRAYCQMECLHLAQLGRQLLDAHVNAGYELKSYFGAGSTASALMKKHDVKEYIGEIPDEMKEGVACAFFGGRFENSVIGEVRRPVWNADINSAYPYAATFLPCLIHGRWRKLTRGLDREIERSTLALVEWHLPKLSPNSSGITAWGPLPVRKVNGTIAFPLGAYSGWTWKAEFSSAQKLRPDLIASTAWLYNSDCKCQPFSFLPGVYLDRIALGKDAKGIVLKLGPNSVYGKLVQSVGIEPPFQCWVWGANITSTCRSQLLDAIHSAPSPANVLMLATDGVWSDVPLRLGNARETGTSHTPKPLGGWDVKVYPRGVFAARPGIYFPLNPTEDDLQKVRARGLGRRVLYEQHRVVQSAFGTGQNSVYLGAAFSDARTRDLYAATQRFIGAKTGLSFAPKSGVKRSPDYGEWVDWPTEVSFDPRPKRESVNADGTLNCWGYFDAPSLPYENALRDPESALLELAALIAEEQPNADFGEYDIGENV